MPLLQYLSNAALEQRDAAQAEAAAVSSELLISNLAAQIQKQWTINRDHRRSAGIDDALLMCLRQRTGEYSPSELAQIREQGGSELYMMLTAGKVRQCAAWISDIMLPAGEKAWGIEPTPVPDLSPELREATIDLLTSEVEQAQEAGVEPPLQEIEERTVEFKRRLLEALQDEADKAAESMETRIEDQLEESGFADALEEFIEDFATYPAAILKGPVYQRKKTLSWGPGGEPVVEERVVECDVRVSPFDIYPSPGAVRINDGRLIEHVRYSRSELSDMIGVPGYDDEAIQQVLEDDRFGFLGDWTNSDSAERRASTGVDRMVDDGLIDALIYWGDASGFDLLDWGMSNEQIPDPYKQYQIEAILIGRHVIRALVNSDPLDRRPYYKASYQNVPGAFWGRSPAQLMSDIQRMCNGAARSLANNMGMASGPMATVNVDMLPQGEVITGLHPWKIFQVNSKMSAAAGSAAPIQFFQPNDNSAALMGVYNQFEAKADAATGVPRYPMGQEGFPAGQMPAQTMAMILETITKDLKAAVRHIDKGVMRPRIRRQYELNMLYSKDDSLKGDLKVVARGASALIAKAATQARRNEFLAITNNETDATIMGIEGRAELLRQMARDMDMSNLIPSDEEIQRKMAEQAQAGQSEDPMVARERMRLEFEMQKLQMQLQDAERERQVKQTLAEYGLQGDMMELAGRKEITLEQIKAKLGETAMRERGNNERFVAERRIKAQYGSGI